jgi:soluble lytic murein transglycosylase-like protein
MKSRLFLSVLVAAAFAVPSFAAPKRVTTTRAPLTARVFPILRENAFPVPMPKHIAAAIREAAAQHGVDPNLVASMAFRESRFDASAPLPASA